MNTRPVRFHGSALLYSVTAAASGSPKTTKTTPTTAMAMTLVSPHGISRSARRRLRSLRHANAVRNVRESPVYAIKTNTTIEPVRTVVVRPALIRPALWSATTARAMSTATVGTSKMAARSRSRNAKPDRH
eukprot:Amastigsp_a851399_6.p3 type:complete len:131 gc:universal Amastigsp_a851399_6:878-486(-)